MKFSPFFKKKIKDAVILLYVSTVAPHMLVKRRPQPITLASGCWTPGIVAHEIGKEGVNPDSSLI